MSKVNFFAISWEEGEGTTEPEFIENLAAFLSPRITVDNKLDRASNQQEAYLKTADWEYRIRTWYLYFRKINFPLSKNPVFSFIIFFRPAKGTGSGPGCYRHLGSRRPDSLSNQKHRTRPGCTRARNGSVYREYKSGNTNRVCFNSSRSQIQ